MRGLAIVAVVAFLGALVAAILVFTWSRQVAAIAFVLGAVALTGGVPAAVDYLGRWGVSGDGL